MEALNAVGLTPLSVLSERRTEPRKISSLPTSSPIKFPLSVNFSHNPQKISKNFSRNLHGGLLLLSSVLSSGFARALTYEEALQQSASSSPSVESSEFDFGGFIDSIINFGVENPLVIAGGVALLGVPLVLSQVFSSPKPWGVESPKNAYTKLGDDSTCQLVDIRPPVEVRQVGSPDIRGLKKRPVGVAYRGEDKVGFLKKLSLKFKEPEKTTLFILDKFDGNSELVAELVTSNGFKAAYAIKDGAEGPRGWMNSGLPWILPQKTLSLDLSNLTDAIGGAIGEGSDALSLTLGIAAATGLGLLAFSEVETILQLLGSVALLQVISKKLLFAEDRKQTLQQVDELLTTKVAPKELGDDIKQIGRALLPALNISKALPGPVEEASPTLTDGSLPKVEAAAEPAPKINSVSKEEVKAESLPGNSRPLSPYPFVILVFTLIVAFICCFWYPYHGFMVQGTEKWQGIQRVRFVIFLPFLRIFRHGLSFFCGKNEFLQSFLYIKYIENFYFDLMFPMLFLSLFINLSPYPFFLSFSVFLWKMLFCRVLM
ncbi:rhodanese-like domain-containing protein 4, chloroplastic isoform X1 [Rhododendron vialii]|uniref:rhodanese-like domain-containing protein 4, chloroplastic isoform X1 n=1 Tax=Rhododendron vialii TaxID=182163 RepID=UPI00265EAD25|nr:rhodanese-like domain-containing protein 4, chloroplastic isoform X1 [Rhododendron vialii]